MLEAGPDEAEGLGVLALPVSTTGAAGVLAGASAPSAAGLEGLAAGALPLDLKSVTYQPEPLS